MNRRFAHCFDANIAALKAMLPPRVSCDSIHPSLGATWIPGKIYASFIKKLLKLKETPEVVYSSELGAWRVKPPYGIGSSIENTYTYGTKDISAVKIIEKTLNAQTVKVYDHNFTPSGRCESTLNEKKTLEAQDKQRLIVSRFDEWVCSDPELERRIENIYNDTFVGYAISAYDGGFLSLPDLNPRVKLYPHQLNVVARILLSGTNLMLAHDVGTGKTYEMVVSAHELKRMGLSYKNLIVVPNNVLKATVDAHRLLYPKDDVLAVFPKDFPPSRRRETMRRIRDEDHVCIYMAYSSFDMITMSKAYWIKKMQADIAALEQEAGFIKESGYTKQAILREVESRKKELSEYSVKGKDPDWLCFDALGIDTLFVDEAHNYKNISITTHSENIIGLRKNGCKKYREMMEKVHSVKRAIFATGTPLTNSLSDLFVFQTYLQPETLKFHKINFFDSWVQTFSEKESNYEIDVTSSQIRPVDRFSAFHNLTELMAMFSTVCDFHHSTGEDIPFCKGPENISVLMNYMQEKYIRQLAERADAVRSHAVKRTEDNLLKITTDGRKCALDFRLVQTGKNNRDVDSIDIGSKVWACAKKVFEIYNAYPGTCQVVFSDIGTPRPEFNIYDALKKLLVMWGIPAAEVAFVHDAVSERARSKLFAAVNSGKVRVVIGSTFKLGIGVNIQEKLIALHHLSVPWRPSDMVQREGRMLRQGNTNPEVFIYRYITEGTFDSYSWQLLENKQRFISSFLSGVSFQRDSEDIADAVLNYAEVKALAIGDPLIKKRVEVSNRLERTRMQSTQRQRRLMELRTIIEQVPNTIESLRLEKSVVASDSGLYRAYRERITLKERRAVGEELLTALAANGMQDDEKLFDSYQGFDIMLPAGMTLDRPYVLVRSRNNGCYRVDMGGDKKMSATQRIDKLLSGLLMRIPDIEKRIREERRKKRAAGRRIRTGQPV